jgi:hypothetical protein
MLTFLFLSLSCLFFSQLRKGIVKDLDDGRRGRAGRHHEREGTIMKVVLAEYVSDLQRQVAWHNEVRDKDTNLPLIALPVRELGT